MSDKDWKKRLKDRDFSNKSNQNAVVSYYTWGQVTMSNEEKKKTRRFMRRYLSTIDHLRLTDDYMCDSHDEWMKYRAVIEDVVERMILRVDNLISHEDLLEKMNNERNFSLINGEEF